MFCRQLTITIFVFYLNALFVFINNIVLCFINNNAFHFIKICIIVIICVVHFNLLIHLLIFK